MTPSNGQTRLALSLHKTDHTKSHGTMNLFALAFRAMCLLMVATLLWNGCNLLNSASFSLFHSSAKENEVIILSAQRVSNQKACFIAESIRQSKPPFYLHGKYEFLRDAPNLNRRQVRQTYCYDRVRQRWWNPFGNLPFGLDHGSLAAIPAGTCHENDPARLLIFNFRTEPCGHPHPELLHTTCPRKDGQSSRCCNLTKRTIGTYVTKFRAGAVTTRKMSLEMHQVLWLPTLVGTFSILEEPTMKSIKIRANVSKCARQ
jgi:hypothetical protein